MKTRSIIPHIRTLVLLVLACGGSIAGTAAVDDNPTSWTSNDGVTIHARLAGWDGRHVFLVRGGRYFEVPVEVLAPECVAKAKRLLGVAAGTRGDIESSSSVARKSTHFMDVAESSWRVPRPAQVPGVGSGNTRMDRHGMPVYPYHVRIRTVRTTAYWCGESDHLIYGSLNALGTPLKYGGELRSAAADWSVYPVGTTFRITGLPWLYVVDDYGSALVGTGTIDVYHPDRGGMKRWGRRNVEVTIVRWGSAGQSARILAGRIRHVHCRRMFDAIHRHFAALRQVASR